MGWNFAQSIIAREWICVDFMDMRLERIEWIKLRTKWKGMYLLRASYHVIFYAKYFVSINLT